jgi:hypothetical protein
MDVVRAGYPCRPDKTATTATSVEELERMVEQRKEGLGIKTLAAEGECARGGQGSLRRGLARRRGYKNRGWASIPWPKRVCVCVRGRGAIGGAWHSDPGRRE